MVKKYLTHADELLYMRSQRPGPLLRCSQPCFKLEDIGEKYLTFYGSTEIKPNGLYPFMAEEGFMFIVPDMKFDMDSAEAYDGLIINFSDKFFGFYRGIEYFLDEFPNKLPVLTFDDIHRNRRNINALTIYSIFAQNFPGETQTEKQKNFKKHRDSLARILRRTQKPVKPLNL